MVYKVLFLVILVLGYFFYSPSQYRYLQKHSDSSRKKYICFSAIVLGLQSALRNVAVGADTYNYYLKFEEIKSTSWHDIFLSFPNTYLYGEGKDPGYMLLEKVFQVFSGDFRVFLFLIAFIFFFSYAKLLLRYSKNTIEVLTADLAYSALFYGFYSITGLRQTLSVALGILFLLSFIDKKYFKSVLLFLVAFILHKSSIFLLLVPVLFSIKNSKVLLVLYSVAFVVFLFGRDYFVNLAIAAADYEAIDIPLPILLDIFYFVISLFIWIRLKKEKNREILGVFNVYSLTFAWIPLLGNDSPLMRAILYFNIYVLVLLPRSISRMPLYKNALFVIINIFFCYYAITSHSEYRFFWEDMQLLDHYL